MYVTVEHQGLGLGGFLERLCKNKGQRHVCKEQHGRTATLTSTTVPGHTRP